MSPDQIKSVLAKHIPERSPEPRKNPDGWSFYLGAPIRGTKTNRIVRATRSRKSSVTRLKLCVSSLIARKDVELEFGGSVANLLDLVAVEVKLYQDRNAHGNRA